MLWQLHQQPRFEGRPTVFYAQREINNSDEAHEFMKDTVEAFPLKEGMQWLICNEESEYFVRMKEQEAQ
jgi:hypothetical protein